MTPIKALLIKLLQAYKILGYPHSLLEAQKFMYFMSALSGDELNLQFAKKQYGPYANKLKYVLRDMEDHYICRQGNRNQKAEIHFLDDAITEANLFLSDKNNYLKKINRIERLIDGFETPFGRIL